LKKGCLWTNEYSLKEQEKFVSNAISDAGNQIGEEINTILSTKDGLLVQVGRKIKWTLKNEAMDA